MSEQENRKELMTTKCICGKSFSLKDGDYIGDYCGKIKLHWTWHKKGY